MSDSRTDEVIGIINHFFAEQKILHELLVASDRFVYRCGFSPHSSKCSTLEFELVVDDSAMQSYVSVQGKFEKAENAIIKYISRINLEFKLGRFEYNFRNGRVAFHFGQRIDIVAQGMNPHILMDQIYYPLTIMDRFAAGFYELAQGGVSPEEMAVKYLSANYAVENNVVK